MKPSTNMFDPFGLMAGGPLGAWQTSLEMSQQMMAAWQQAWLPLVRTMLGGAALPTSLLPMFPLASAKTFTNPLATFFPFARMLPQVEAMLTPVRGPSGEDDAARLSLRVQVPAMPGSGAAERLAVEALIARQQGRQDAWLGCLQGAKVVYPAADTPPAEKPAAIEAEPAMETPVTQLAVKASRNATSAKPAPKTVAKPAKAAASPVKLARAPAKPRLIRAK